MRFFANDIAQCSHAVCSDGTLVEIGTSESMNFSATDKLKVSSHKARSVCSSVMRG